VRVSSGAVVKAFDVVADRRGSKVARGEVLVVDVFSLERGEKAFSDGIVVAIARSAHARHDAVGREDAPVVVAGVRAASVGVMDETRARATRPERLVERGEREVAVVGGTRGPSDDASGKQIE